jgi:hypothetical protein
MPVREPALASVALIAAVLLGGCGPAVQNTVPYLTHVREARKQVRGAQIKVQFRPQRPDVTGELIAASADSLWYLADRHLETIATPELLRATIDVYEGGEAGWWQPPILHVIRPNRWACARLSRHARFPQGLPDGLDRTTLKAP